MCMCRNYGKEQTSKVGISNPRFVYWITRDTKYVVYCEEDGAAFPLSHPPVTAPNPPSPVQPLQSVSNIFVRELSPLTKSFITITQCLKKLFLYYRDFFRLGIMACWGSTFFSIRFGKSYSVHHQGGWHNIWHIPP